MIKGSALDKQTQNSYSVSPIGGLLVAAGTVIIVWKGNNHNIDNAKQTLMIKFRKI